MLQFVKVAFIHFLIFQTLESFFVLLKKKKKKKKNSISSFFFFFFGFFLNPLK